MEAEIYTDGACSGNPGSGGFGVLVKVPNKKDKTYSKGYRLTTNNRMELMAAIHGLKKVPEEIKEVTIYSDSKYLIDAINQRWIDKWIAVNFSGVKNSDLWTKFWDLYKERTVQLIWVKGHNGNMGNEICDKLATEAARFPRYIDRNYENKK